MIKILIRAKVLRAEVAFIERTLLRPLHLSSGVIAALTEARAKVAVRVGDREAEGVSNIYLSTLWSWPDPKLTNAYRDAALRAYAAKVANDLPAIVGDPAHPLELGLRLHEAVLTDRVWPPTAGAPPPWQGGRTGEGRTGSAQAPLPTSPRKRREEDAAASSVAGHATNAHGGRADPADPAAGEIPVLARAMCASPLDAAIHDATGIALGLSAFDFYRDAPAGRPLAAVARLLQSPRNRLDAWWIVGATDALDGDLAHAVREQGFRCFKLKTTGRDPAADARRTAEVFRALQRLGVAHPVLTADSNEASADADAVLEYLRRLEEADAAFAALAYLEQPTPRDILTHRYDWRRVAALKPVLLDEGLTSLDILPEAQAQGWSGLALKTCKGHSFALAAAAWAREHGMPVALQDLTNPGYSAIHAALFAAHVPTINGVELNSPQFTPDANAEWLPRLQDLFLVKDGMHRVSNPRCIGLGSTL